MKAMLVLRYVAVLALAVWFGGLVVLGGVAAQAIFAVVASYGLVDGQALAGAIFGEALRRFHPVAYACGGVILVSLITRRILGPRPRPFGIRLAVGILMLAAMLYSGFVILPAVTRVRQQIGPTVSASTLPADDPRRAAFERLHERSRLVLLMPLVGAFLLLFFELSDHDGDRSWPR
jgi:hypothetical protein